MPHWCPYRPYGKGYDRVQHPPYTDIKLALRLAGWSSLVFKTLQEENLVSI